MADSEKQVEASSLDQPMDLATGAAHTLKLDGGLTLVVFIAPELSGAVLVVRDEAGKELHRLAAAEAKDQGDGYRAFDLKPLDADQRHLVELMQDELSLAPPSRIKVAPLESALAGAADDDAAVGEFCPAPAAEDDAAGDAPDRDGGGDGDGDGGDEQDPYTLLDFLRDEDSDEETT